MLSSVARRRLRRDAFRTPTQLAQQLTLPWLCPAQMRTTASISSPTTPSSTDSRKQRLPASSSLSPRHDTRSLATQADVQSTDGSMSFNGIVQNWGSRVPTPRMAKLDSWDPSNPLVINATLALAAPSTPKRAGIGGDPIELHQNLYACLRVGRMDRAMAIISRLSSLYSPSAPELVDAHNIYLQTMLDQAQESPAAVSLDTIDGWYQANMVQKAVEPSAQTFVTLLRAAMTLPCAGDRDDAVRKYLVLASEYGTGLLDEVNSSSDFSDEEWDTLIRLQPEEFDEPPQADIPVEASVNSPLAREKLIEHGILSDPNLHIKSVPQKGLGLDTLKRSLSAFDSDVEFPHDMEGTQAEKERAHALMRQIRIEKDSQDAAVERWKTEDEKLQEMGIHGVIKSKPIQALMHNWYLTLLPKFKEEFKRTQQVLSNQTVDTARDPRNSYGPFLELITPEKLAAMTIQRTLAASARGMRGDQSPLRIATIATSIGGDIEAHAKAEAKRKYTSRQKKARIDARKQMLARLSKTDAAPRFAPRAEAPSIVDTLVQTDFPTHIKLLLGSMALENLMGSAFITVAATNPKTGKEVSSTQSAFGHTHSFRNGRKIGFISPHQDIMDKLVTQPVHSVQALHLPMVAEPVPWTDYESGAYYRAKSNVMRDKNKFLTQRAYAQSAIGNGDMDKVLAALDVLGRVPWKINESVFRVVAEAWNAGEGIGGLVAEKPFIQRPEEPNPDATVRERVMWAKMMQEYENTKSGLHSQRCFQNFQLEIARAYVKEDKMYFPHNVDFRGRAYPIPPVLNHMGADLARGLLQFANAKELGTVGLQWLKVHLANLYGFDKASLSEREQFAMDNIAEIYDSATNPLDGRRWWSKAEDPWQCLACCVELKNALDSPDPTRYMSRLPVHQDGTCNGLQHYAALGGDEAGATQVNLEPSDRPQDIYTGVADMVSEMISEDAAKGQKMALFIDGKVTRKVVKRTVMTNVYGVTFMGAKVQVLDELKAMFPNFTPVPGVNDLGLLAVYISKKIFAALGKIFNGAQEIQYWLGECGDRITTSLSPEQIERAAQRLAGSANAYGSKYQVKTKGRQQNVREKLSAKLEGFRTGIIWTTPLRMPVVQPYFKETNKLIRTSLQDITITTRSASAEVDKRKQLQGFPPNFIHSLDATHMLLSALKCEEMGLDFAAVHDSFWTHAADIPTLSVILRDAFVRMHSEDIVKRLAAEFEARYAGHMYRANIKVTSVAAHKILDWRTEQRKAGKVKKTTHRCTAVIDELVLEAERQALLKSEDPVKRKEGEEMVTPTSIWLALGSAKDLSSSRLALLGDTSTKNSTTFEKVKDKVLGMEADATDSPEASNATIPDEDPLEDDEELGADAEPLESDVEAEASDKPKRQRTPKRASLTTSVQVWLPLTFPPVPKKGGWDVSRLRESKYFFS
ncbi:mitochondrial DNA-directed RNA polymeras-like protein [Corynespora cassiicola Philippines]|uniref:DNA-directed RNA polymerase n=1 Tax=Corynespora cassiicola Philippines TaxID=1448308 RepID=A0A2T2NAN2_CORCC|nr:mitochondrial DNA-directed RNA polymeras-like protein [Corynespora cassiicola Philippines]